ncbi:hypothetical protein BLS_009168 [Venturia inaequalis]|uniref:Uncharacterized protein n=1 Tax=Venturia inaequalis TaxID=5025 RepID=A0A8H3V0D3_VENIN|nr:hypothetical protein BLS_009168 [Venturia inaequalis]
MLHTIAESGAGIAGAQSIHANVYATQPVAKFATPDQLKRFLPPLISGQTRACFGVTEPNTGLETLKLKTFARKDGENYYVTGQKIWISSAQVASKMILLARTTALEDVKKPSEGLSLFFIDFDTQQPGLELKRIKKMGGRAIDANEVFFDNYKIPTSSLIGSEGQGFKIVLHGMNAERCLLAGEALGLGYVALSRAAKYAQERIVFGRPIGQNQGIQHPLADAYMNLEAAKLATYHATRFFFVPGAKVVCDLAIDALLVPLPGTSADATPESNLSPDDQQEAANVSLPQSPEPGHRHQNEEDLGVDYVRIAAESFSVRYRAGRRYDKYEKSSEQYTTEKDKFEFSWFNECIQKKLDVKSKSRYQQPSPSEHLHIASSLTPPTHRIALRNTPRLTMPTPYSEAFLKKQPQVPPTFAGVDYDDQHALKAAQDSIIREQWVRSMMARLVREEMGKCYWREGVNHLEKCGHLRERYLELLKDAKIKGFLFAQQNYITPENLKKTKDN